MYNLQLPLLLLYQLSLSSTARASSSSPSQRIPITLTETTDLAPAGESLANGDNGISLYYADHGDPIPLVELDQILRQAIAVVYAHLPLYAHQHIFQSSFEKNHTFLDTGDNIYLWVYAYGWGLNYQQLYQALKILQQYILGNEPSQAGAHSQELEFYIQVLPAVEVARGRIEFTRGTRATAKRNPITTTLHSPQEANLSSSTSDTVLPIHFPVARNLNLNITELGAPIPESTIEYTIDRAFTQVLLDHDDIEASIPVNQPFSFNKTSGRYPGQLYITNIFVAPQKRASLSWETLCLSLYGLRDFMRVSRHFNAMKFEITSPRKGVLGTGEIKYWAEAETA